MSETVDQINVAQAALLYNLKQPCCEEHIKPNYHG